MRFYQSVFFHFWPWCAAFLAFLLFALLWRDASSRRVLFGSRIRVFFVTLLLIFWPLALRRPNVLCPQIIISDGQALWGCVLMAIAAVFCLNALWADWRFLFRAPDDAPVEARPVGERKLWPSMSARANRFHFDPFGIVALVDLAAVGFGFFLL